MKCTSIYKSIDGPKLRRLYKTLGCSKPEAIGILYFLWDWGLDNADEDGALAGLGKDDISRYLYGVSSDCRLNMDDVVDALVATGWLDESEDGLVLHDWYDWQGSYYRAKERRKKDAARKAEERRITRRIETQATQAVPASPLSETVSEPVTQGEEPMQESMFGDVEPKQVRIRAEPVKSRYAEGFLQFWEAYPRKLGKGDAYKKYQARRKDGFSDEELIQSAKNYAAECRSRRTEKEYIKHPKTFLSDSLPFTDYLPKNDDKPKTQQSGNPFEEWGDLDE